MLRAFSLFFLLTASAAAQYFEPFPKAADPTRPAWVSTLQEDPTNIRRIDSAFEADVSSRVFVKDEYTQYYKRFRRWAAPHVTAEGRLRVPSPTETAEMQGLLRAQRGTMAKRASAGGASAGWTFLGPKTTHSTGRDNTPVAWQTNIYCLDQSVTDPDILFAGGETGGIFRSTDRGLSWSQVSGDLLHGSVRPVKIDPTDADIVFAGTSGKLVKSVDGGTTWTDIYGESDLWTHDMLVCADDAEVLCAATNRGLMRSTDAGATWTKVFSGECWTVAAHPTDARIIYTIRDSANTSIFSRSTDRGATFDEGGAIGWWRPAATQEVYGARLTVSAADPDRIYVLVGASEAEPDRLHNYAGVFVSSDAGVTWRNTNPSGLVGEPYSVPAHTNLSAADGLAGLSQGFYDFAIIADPQDANALVAGGTSWWRSSDAGATWHPLGGYAGGLPWAHPDMQWLSARGGELWICSDGGITYSTDFALSHETRMNGIAGSDFWGFDAGWNEDVFVGGRYHNGNTAFLEGYPDGRFLRMGGGEAATGYLHPDNNRRAYFSDIGGYIIPDDPAGNPIPFSVGLWPNETYWYGEFSGMSFDPRCSGTVYIGNGNGLWKSLDAGASYAIVQRFVLGADSTAAVEHVQIPRCNPSVIYASQRSNRLWDGAIWRSSDAGATWTRCAQIPGTSGGERRVITMTASGTDENVLWVALRSGSPERKVFKTTDGGATWINQTTPTIAHASPSYIVHQLGTEGGVYLGTTAGGLYYRNDAMVDWMPYADGLPLSLSTRFLRPFYRDGKIRTGSDMGIWEAPLFEPSAPLAQISVDKMHSNCPRDTFYFSDRSVLRRGADTRWTWSFPGAAFVSSTIASNPKVLYPASGTYTVSLTIDEGGRSDSQTLQSFITVDAGGCDPDTVPGFAVALGGNNDPGLVEVPPLGIRTNTFTFSAWVKPDGIQPSFSSIVCGNAVEINIDGDNELHYHWPPNGRWWVGSGLRVPSDAWSFVAMIVTPDSIILYVNGRSWTVAHPNDSVTFSSGMLLGNYNHWGSRYYKGEIDEVCFFDRALTQDEIRERMHLTRFHPRVPSASDTGLIAYYQFNERDGHVNDRVATSHAQMVGSAARVASSGPFGGGTSARRELSAAGTVDFPGTGVTLSLPAVGVYPDGDIVVSRIDLPPDTRPNLSPGSRAYWLADNYGTNESFTSPDSIRFAGYGAISTLEADDPGIYSLHTRSSNAHGASWGAAPVSASAASSGPDGSVAFSPRGSTQFGQYYITRDGTPTSIESGLAAFPADPALYPTALRAGQEITLSAAQDDRVDILLSNASGQLLVKRVLHSGEKISTAGLSAGYYHYWLRTSTRIRGGIIVLR
jgi:photosystem II stability/assembly factor-like uncharacterized protein